MTEIDSKLEDQQICSATIVGGRKIYPLSWQSFNPECKNFDSESNYIEKLNFILQLEARCILLCRRLLIYKKNINKLTLAQKNHKDSIKYLEKIIMKNSGLPYKPSLLRSNLNEYILLLSTQFPLPNKLRSYKSVLVHTTNEIVELYKALLVIAPYCDITILEHLLYNSEKNKEKYLELE